MSSNQSPMALGVTGRSLCQLCKVAFNTQNSSHLTITVAIITMIKVLCQAKVLGKWFPLLVIYLTNIHQSTTPKHLMVLIQPIGGFRINMSLWDLNKTRLSLIKLPSLSQLGTPSLQQPEFLWRKTTALTINLWTLRFVWAQLGKLTWKSLRMPGLSKSMQ